jgi:hypothetical protein
MSRRNTKEQPEPSMTRPPATPALPATADRLAAALAAANRGWHVFPVAPGGKTPVIKAWEQRATTDPDRIRRCWATGAWNVGIACGPSRLLVIDLDKPKPGQAPPPPWDLPGVNDGYDALAVVCERAGQPLPIDTHTVTTGRGGTHLYYRHPAHGPDGLELRNTSGAKGGGLGWLIDTRAGGGYVLAAGSVVDGNPYTTTHDAAPIPLPAWLTEALRPAPLPEQAPVTITPRCLSTGTSTDRAGRYVQAALTAQLGHLEHACAGSRNHALYTSAVALGQLVAGGALPEAEVTGLLDQTARRCWGADYNGRETARTIASGLRAGARRPRKVTT